MSLCFMLGNTGKFLGFEIQVSELLKFSKPYVTHQGAQYSWQNGNCKSPEMAFCGVLFSFATSIK